jgi:hypothetical protein
VTDAEFWISFWNQKLTDKCWTHEAHLRFGYLLLIRYDFPTALEKAREGIQQLNKTVGVTKIGYHETITRAFLILIQKALAKNSADTFIAFQEQNPELFEKNLRVLKKYYSNERLFGLEAKERFMEPDLESFA